MIGNFEKGIDAVFKYVEMLEDLILIFIPKFTNPVRMHHF